jgi:hypothetical protein
MRVTDLAKYSDFTTQTRMSLLKTRIFHLSVSSLKVSPLTVPFKECNHLVTTRARLACKS